MTISKVWPSPSPYQSDLHSPWRQRAQDFKALGSALQSGNLPDAQQAFAALQKDQQNIPPPANASNASGQSTPASKDFQALQSALTSGDLSAAQQAFATLKQDLQGAGRTQHHHHHHHGSVSSTAQTANPASGSSQLVGSTLNIQA